MKEESYLLVAEEVDFGGRQNVRDGAESVEQHGHELDDQNQREEEHEHQTDRFQLQVFLRDVHLNSRNNRNEAKEAKQKKELINCVLNKFANHIYYTMRPHKNELQKFLKK